MFALSSFTSLINATAHYSHLGKTLTHLFLLSIPLFTLHHAHLLQATNMQLLDLPPELFERVVAALARAAPFHEIIRLRAVSRTH